jgi:hypothetical protein
MFGKRAPDGSTTGAPHAINDDDDDHEDLFNNNNRRTNANGYGDAMSSVPESVVAPSEEEAERNELLEYDMWEGQFNLSEDTASTGVAKAIKNAKNQQRLFM